MPEVLLFVEDSAQEKFLTALLKRMAAERSVPLTVRIRSARGGLAKVLGQLEDFANAVEKNQVRLPDGLVVGVDANCRGFQERRNAVQSRAGKLSEFIVHAIPDPHIERWFLLDGEAFKTAVGRGCKAPDAKCEKERYKRLLNTAVLDAGVQPLLGGAEYAEDIVKDYHIQRVADLDESFGKLVAEFRSWLNRQQRGI